MKVEGSCLCGIVTYQADVDEYSVTICNCTDCQTHSGSAFRVTVPTEENSFQLLSGEPKVFVKIAQSGNRRALAFCPVCGTPIYSKSADGQAGLIGLRVGPLRQRGSLVPSTQIWGRSAQSWTDKISEIPKFDSE
ncbi:MAG TPA: GFA family protein [Aestuariivirga sp.]|nr:GFA family protein [Aestuariivirga sp.]